MSWCSFAIASDKKAERLSASLTLVLTAVVYKCEAGTATRSFMGDRGAEHLLQHSPGQVHLRVLLGGRQTSQGTLLGRGSPGWLFLFLMVVENCFAEQLQSLTAHF